MNSYIKKLQSKSEDTRKQILVASLVVSMFFVGSIWVYGLGNHFNQDTKAQASSDIKPFKLFVNSISNTYQNITASVGNASTNKKADEQVAPQKQIDLIPVESAQ